MSIHWNIEKVDAPGGAWLVTRSRTQTEYETNETPTGEVTTAYQSLVSKSVSAYTTLSHARRSIVDELQLSKRVRMTKHSDTHYTYNYIDYPF
jgi:hypothetical protein